MRAFDLIAIDPERDEKESQQNQMRPVSIIEIHSQPGLNEIPREAFEVDHVRMRRIGRNGRPSRDCERRCELPQRVDAK